MMTIHRAVLLSLGCTFVSVIVTLAVVAIRTAKLATGKLKGTLQDLFPDYDWEFTGVYYSITKITYTIYYQEGFLARFPDAETMLREALLVKTPKLAKLEVTIKFIPREEFKY